VTDVNIPYLAKFLWLRGITLNRVEVVHDIEEDIAESLRRISPTVDFLFTSGGIGPTHDDITYQSVAYAFNLPLKYDEETMNKMTENFSNKGLELNEARKRMALFPHPYKTAFSPNLWVPIVIVKNVYILPGIPQLFQKMIEGNQNLFEKIGELIGVNVYTNMLEGDFAFQLQEIQNQNQDTKIGSYPSYGREKGYSARIYIEGLNREKVEKVSHQIKIAVKGQFDIPTLQKSKD